MRPARAAVVLHDDCEPLGMFEQWLPDNGVEVHTVREYAGDTLPTELSDWAAVVILGGPQAVYAPGDITDTESALVARCLTEGLPLLGICLGAQLLAQVAGGRVARGPGDPERGVTTVEVLPAAADDALFAMVPTGEQQVVQWHGDGIAELPDGAVLLARSTDYPVQAFRVGASAWGVQFHPEATPDIVTGWAAMDGVDASDLLPAVEQLDLGVTWRSVVESFAHLAVGAVTTGGG